MSNASPRFVEFIEQCLTSLELQNSAVNENRFMIKVGDRWLELRYDPRDDRVTLFCLIYMRAPNVGLRADLISGFNAQNLFKGGYALVAVDKTFVYLCQPHRLESLELRKIREVFEGFVMRADAASAGYLTNADDAIETPPSSAAAPVRLTQTHSASEGVNLEPSFGVKHISLR